MVNVSSHSERTGVQMKCDLDVVLCGRSDAGCQAIQQILEEPKLHLLLTVSLYEIGATLFKTLIHTLHFPKLN